jgi:Zn-finger domain-containing protein
MLNMTIYLLLAIVIQKNDEKKVRVSLGIRKMRVMKLVHKRVDEILETKRTLSTSLSPTPSFALSCTSFVVYIFRDPGVFILAVVFQSFNQNVSYTNKR